MAGSKNKADESARPSLYVNVRKSKDGPVLLRKNVCDADLMDYRSEAWHSLCLRKGQPDVGLEDVNFDLCPVYQSGEPGRLSGFSLVTSGTNGKRLHFEFTMQAVEHIAIGALRELIASGVLQAGDEYYYELCAEKVPKQSHNVNREIAITTTSTKLQYAIYPIRRLLEQAVQIGLQEAPLAPVFYTHDALTRAELFARRGGNQHPAIETGCILVGTLCFCPETGELYVVVRDALEAQDAESTKFSLEYSGPTWTRMQAILRARQSRPDGRADRFVGQAHGHPFLPAGGAPPCELCAERPDLPCARTSCFVSLDDSQWTRAVFARQPWQLCHIFGLNARNERVQKLFGLRNGQLLERGYSVVPEFTPDEPHLTEQPSAAALVAGKK